MVGRPRSAVSAGQVWVMAGPCPAEPRPGDGGEVAEGAAGPFVIDRALVMLVAERAADHDQQAAGGIEAHAAIAERAVADPVAHVARADPAELARKGDSAIAEVDDRGGAAGKAAAPGRDRVIGGEIRPVRGLGAERRAVHAHVARAELRRDILACAERARRREVREARRPFLLAEPAGAIGA